MRVRKHNPRRWSQGALAALLGTLTLGLLVWLVVMPATRVQAATYTVNVATDDGDDNPGDGVCHTAAGECSLRAAIDEANASVDDDVIAIGVSGPIVLLGGLPTITDDDLIITGSGQQVSLTAPGTAFAINADRVQVNNLVVDGEGVGTIGVQLTATTDDTVLDSLTVRNFTGDGFDSGAAGGQRNTVRNSTFTANGGNGIDFNGGDDNVVKGNVITNNGDGVGDDDGVELSFEDDFLIQGNTFSGNQDAQILIGDLAASDNVLIIQNSITSSSDGIVVGALVDGAASIDIGLSVDNRNVFRGAIAAPAEQHLRDLSAVNINAIYNDWDAYSPAGIEGVICHDADPGCGPGVVDFDPFIDTPSPLPTATPPSTITPTPGTPTETPTATPPATGTPGGVETLPLIAGCNPVAWTGSDNTPIATIAGAVSPPGILVALWEFEGGIWLGYSPQFPEVSDLTEKDRLDVVFVCGSAAGTFSRPVI